MNDQSHNKLICGDNLEELAKLPKESVANDSPTRPGRSQSQ